MFWKRIRSDWYHFAGFGSGLATRACRSGSRSVSISSNGTVAGTAPQVRWVHRLTSSLPPPLPQEPQEIGQPRMRPASRSLPGPPPGRCAERTLGHGPNRSPVGQSPPDHSYSAPSLGGWVGPWCIALDWMVCGQQAPPPPPLYTIDPLYFCTTTRPPPSGPPPPPPLHYSRVVSRLNGNYVLTQQLVPAI